MEIILRGLDMTFEEKIHEMFDSIWDCEIDHPLFQDTVGELMEAVIQAYHITQDQGTDLVCVGGVLDLINNTHSIGGFSDYSFYSALFDNVDSLRITTSEIIHCQDCKHFIREDIEEHTPYGYNTCFHAFCNKHWDKEQGEYIDVNLDDFCSLAERREDG